MKKRLCLALGIVLMALLPGGKALGQNKTVQITVKTLDHRALESAYIYAAAPGTSYFIDTAHLSTSYTGTALPIDSVDVRDSLAVGEDPATGDPIIYRSNIDSATYAYSFIVARDVNGGYYVYGNTTGIANGIIAGTQLFEGTGDSLTVTLGSSESMVMSGEKAVIADMMRLYLYTSIADAIADSRAAQIVFLDTVRLDSSININRSISINQTGRPLISQTTTSGYLFSIGGNNTVLWSNGKIYADAGNHFRVADNATLNINGLYDSAATSVVAVSGNGTLTAANSIFHNEGAAAVVTLSDNSHATLSQMTIEGGAFGVTIPQASMARLDIDAQSVTTGMPGYARPVNADCYVKDAANADNRIYLRGLNRASALIDNLDTLFVVSDLAAGEDTVSKASVVDLGGFTATRNIAATNTDGIVTVTNGTVNGNIASSGASIATLDLADVDFNGTLSADILRTTRIQSGRYNPATPFSGTNIVINGGKFADTVGYTNMLAARHLFIDNTETDAAEYPYMVAEGYGVTYINYDCKNHDTVIVYNTPDNRITPVLSEPRYPGTDTVFLAFVREEGNLQTAWQNDVDVLSSDTTLYAMWLINGITYTYKTRHFHISLENDTVAVDSVSNVAPEGSALRIRPRNYPGRVPNVDIVNISSLTQDTVIDFYYSLVKYELAWDAQGGQFADGSPVKIDSLYYGETIILPEEPIKRGYTFAEWTPNDVTTMPDGNLTINATYDQATYTLTWTGADTTVVYNAAAVEAISAVLIDTAFGDTIATTLYYVDTVTNNEVNPVVNVGAYRVTARLANYQDVYVLTDSVSMITVEPATLTFNTIEVATEKPYDGTTIAVITGDLTQILNGVLANDDVQIVSASAAYDTPDTGSNKTINVHMVVGGADAANYTPLEKDSAIANCIIFMPVEINTDVADSGIAVDASGYCAGTGAINIIVRSGSPDEYVLYFEDDNFTDIDSWTTISNIDNDTLTLDIVVPEGVNNGIYTAWLRLRNSNHSAYVSDSVRIQFRVNLPRTYTMPLFDDVIALVDTCHCFTNIQWYRDGVAIPGANGYYYQEQGGLAGHTYYVTALMNGQATTTCEQDDMNTLLHNDGQQAQTTVSAYPNPTTQAVNVTIANSNASVHTVRVMNVMGVTVENTTFDGDSTTIDMSNMANGSYTVSVDGIVVRVIKK